jgi:hypothetical protein
VQVDKIIKEILRRLTVLENDSGSFSSADDRPEITTSESRTLVTYGDLTTVGPTLTDVEIPGSGRLVVVLSAIVAPNGGEAAMSFTMSGDVTAAATDNRALLATSRVGCSSLIVMSGLAEGFVDITAKYRSDGTNNAAFSNRSMLVAPL